MELLYPIFALVGVCFLGGTLLAVWDEKKPKIQKKKEQHELMRFLNDDGFARRLNEAKRIYKIFRKATDLNGGTVLVSRCSDAQPNNFFENDDFLPRHESKGCIWFHAAVENYDRKALEGYWQFDGKTTEEILENQENAKVRFIERLFGMSYEEVSEIINPQTIIINAEIRKSARYNMELEFSYGFLVPDNWDSKRKELFIKGITGR